ncbi:hypothetical protein J437_LFUL005850 [Ladona fulva]|uniref:Kinesin motor domain-containing protein n=1 Tax=Ladona fulva TaxID=123851 RepID=A0A8K0K903_LADFU|nr:hypothetical protein J437_LFUL005850 [Ladona fulva]
MDVPIQVAVRVRPFTYQDRNHDVVCLNSLPHSNQIILGDGNVFDFDYVLPIGCTQSQFFNTAIGSLLNYVLEGYDTSVITYGQTASGKTYTLFGPGVHCALSETEFGIIPRATRELFHQLGECLERNFVIKVTFLGIQEDIVCDLLNTNQFQREVIISEDQYGSVIVDGADEVICQNIAEVFNCIHIGMSNRHANFSSLSCNSVNCHTIFMISVKQQWEADSGMIELRTSKLIFADLAGSERTYSSEGINGWFPGIIKMDPGLTALANVVSALSDPVWKNQRESPPYMESNLTKILKDSFGGRARALFVCCLSPASLDFDESLNSLRYATRVQSILNHPAVNVCVYSNHMKEGNLNCCPRFTMEHKNANDEIFGLEFAALQWMKLVSNAEGLFKKMILNESITVEEKERIRLWLCLKQECDDCVGLDENPIIEDNEETLAHRSLTRIEELTENEDKTDDIGDVNDNLSEEENNNSLVDSNQDLSQFASENESDINSQTPDFLDKLDEYMKIFKEKTDSYIWETIESLQFKASVDLTSNFTGLEEAKYEYEE